MIPYHDQKADDLLAERKDDGIGASNAYKRAYYMGSPALGKDTQDVLFRAFEAVYLPHESPDTRFDPEGMSTNERFDKRALSGEGGGPERFSGLLSSAVRSSPVISSGHGSRGHR